MTILPRNTEFVFEYGWKVKPDECGKSAEEEYLRCIEERAYPKSEIFVDLDHSNVKTLVTFFFNFYHGLDQYLELHTGLLTQNYLTSTDIKFNSNISYTLIVMDPKLFIVSEIHDRIPRYKLKISKNVNINLYLKVFYDD